MCTYMYDETGAVTVDWVVLTAGLVGLGLAAMAVVSSGVQDTATDITDFTKTDLIGTSFFASGDFTTSSVDYSNWQMTLGGTVEFVETGGSDGEPGFIKTTDQAGAFDIVDLGPEFKGDQTDLIGGTISFDMNKLGGPAGAHMNDQGLIFITGTNGNTLRYKPTTPIPENEWQTYNIAFTPSSAWSQSNGDPVDQATINAILTDVHSTELIVDHVNGNDVYGIDNFTSQRMTEGINYDGS